MQTHLLKFLNLVSYWNSKSLGFIITAETVDGESDDRGGGRPEGEITNDNASVPAIIASGEDALNPVSIPSPDLAFMSHEEEVISSSSVHQCPGWTPDVDR